LFTVNFNTWKGIMNFCLNGKCMVKFQQKKHETHDEFLYNLKAKVGQPWHWFVS
jgi:hypothetical protein